MKKSFQVAAGVLISAVCLWFTFRGFDFAELRRQVATYSIGWMIPAAFMYCLSFGLRSARWQWILAPIKPLRYWTVAPILVFGFFMNTVLPARAGEFARA